jgi:deazaflavin-dependent oxidoreductase (nitroreductase family)
LQRCAAEEDRATPSSSESLLEELAGEAFCYVTTTGRVSGRPHRIEIWFAYDDGRLYLLAGGGERADWVRNLRRDPSVTLEVGDFTGPATATILEDAGEDAVPRRLLAAKYQGWQEGQNLSDWARTALLVAIQPGRS